MPRWRRRGGDFDHDEELNRKVSPLYHVDKIRAPLLIGQGKNDPRVTIATTRRDGGCSAQGETRSHLRRVSRRRSRLQPAQKTTWTSTDASRDSLAEHLGESRGTVEENQRFDR